MLQAALFLPHLPWAGAGCRNPFGEPPPYGYPFPHPEEPPPGALVFCSSGTQRASRRRTDGEVMVPSV